MEIAINIRAKIASPTKVYEKLTGGGWRVRDAAEVTQTPWCYQKYIRDSRAEFSVSKHGYVVTQCGWFSERSAAYLASGRPVILQDTGFSSVLPCGKGLLAYRDRDEAITAISRLHNEYEAHCRAARELVEEFFDSRRVLNELLKRSL
jgi:glycosyltransferase involved in cell wall biosynthesis